MRVAGCARSRRAGAAVLAALAWSACGGRPAPTPSPEPGSLLRAAAEGDAAAVERLLALGSPVEAVDDAGRTPLIRAAGGGHLPVVKALLARGARVDAREYSGRTPLVAALVSGHDAVARHLVEAGASPAGELPPWTPLRLAGFTGAAATVDALLARGADPAAADRYGLDALMYAAGRGHAPVVTRLLSAGASTRAADARGHTALMFAAGGGHDRIAAALVAAGADPRARNRAGQTATDLARANGHRVAADAVTPPGRAADLGQPVAVPAALRASSGEDADLDAAARRAWAYVEASYRPATGLVDGTSGWAKTTMWDTGSALAAFYSARELGLLPEAEYKARLRRCLQTLDALPLFQDVTFDRQYSTLRVGPGARAGWSATDLGRLLLWLKIVAVRDPEFAPAAERVARRTKAARVVRDGFLWGATAGRAGDREFQEGRIGYEQYAAAGFAAWGMRARNAEVLTRYALPMRVLGQPVLADLRGDDRLTSDPLVLMGMELGWSPAAERLARGMLAAQEERWRRSGRVTILGEDAIARPPHFFYYYCLYNHGREFAVDVQQHDAVVKGPRWTSVKNAFAWHALLPSDYTRRALDAVRPAAARGGWASGVYEEGGGSTGTLSMNTQAVILEAALYRKTRRPFLAGVAAGGGSSQEES